MSVDQQHHRCNEYAEAIRDKRMAKRRWIQKAVARQKRRGTVGAFGKATKKKIAAGLRKGGLAAKRANFARNLAKISRRHAARKRRARR